jgi:creatinine amidohydrolase/Fe(II)-dependent formamide hydrolase-like protein
MFSLRHETFIAAIREIAAWAVATGWKRLLLVNSHFGRIRLTALAEACVEAVRKQDAAALATLESEINRIVYRLFALTPAEIAIVESSVP